jgi:transglutaminase-like putative cysteine protease
MSTSPFLIASSLLLWGAATGLSQFALPMAAVLEGSRGVAWRWKLTESDQNRIADLCSVIFLAMVLYAVSRGDATHTVYTLLQWSPIALFPLMAAQAYGAEGRIRLTAFFYSLRRVREHRERIGSVDIGHAYLVVCVLAASAVARPLPWFYPVLCLILAWALWSARRLPQRPAHWGALIALAAILGYPAQAGLHRAQLAFEDAVGPWLWEVFHHHTDPYRATTAIGYIGKLKLSDRIVLRVTASGGASPPLLREASYNSYTTFVWRRNPDSVGVGTWFARRAPFYTVSSEDGATWKLAEYSGVGRSVTVSRYLEDGEGLLALPAGTYRVGGLPADHMERNNLGAVTVQGGPGLVTYRADYRPGSSLDEPPAEADLQVPKVHQAVMGRLTEELGLRGLSAAQAVQAVQDFFGEQFTYSLAPLEKGPQTPTLEEFLLRTRTGHCEYFATATVLLLRTAGIPARYAVGYSIQEYSPREHRYVVRSRHAHSWTLAYVDGRWRDLDTTPAAWAGIEEAEAPVWEGLYDFGSWVLYALAQWRWSSGEAGLRAYLAWLLIPLTMLLLWRLRSTERVRRQGTKPRPGGVGPTGPGSDSELYQVVEQLRREGFLQPPGEPLGCWLQRVAETPNSPETTHPLQPLVALHYRYRFDPRGLTAEERIRLRVGVRAWLHNRSPHGSPRPAATRAG